MEKNEKRKKELEYELKELDKKDGENKVNMKQHILDSEDIVKSIDVKKNEINKFKESLKEYEDKIPEFEDKCNKNKAEVDEAKEEFDRIETQMQSLIAKPKAELQKLEDERGKLRLTMQKEENEIQRMKDMSQESDIKRLLGEIKNVEDLIEHEHINMKELEKDYQHL
jgi:chromosome segregation ATPase